jgi:DNA-directed RNA polymerase specialized sigma24 family protein
MGAAGVPDPVVLRAKVRSRRLKHREESLVQRVDRPEFREDPNDGADPYLCLYRGQTIALLRRFMRTSMETGRLPSLLGREFFRAKVSSWQAATFEDAVIFVHDMERSLEKLDSYEQQLIAKIVLQEHSQAEAARMLHSTLRSISRNYAQALDHLSRILLAGEILKPFAVAKAESESSCQETKRKEFMASCCGEGGNIF